MSFRVAQNLTLALCATFQTVHAQVIAPRERWLMPLYDWFCPQHGTPQAAECWRYATIPQGTQVETDPRGLPFVIWKVGVLAAPGTSGVFDPEKVLHWIDVPEAELQVGLPCSAPKGALSLRPIHDEPGQPVSAQRPYICRQGVWQVLYLNYDLTDFVPRPGWRWDTQDFLMTVDKDGVWSIKLRPK